MPLQEFVKFAERSFRSMAGALLNHSVMWSVFFVIRSVLRKLCLELTRLFRKRFSAPTKERFADASDRCRFSGSDLLLDAAKDLLEMVRWCGTCCDKLPGSFVEVEQQQETNALDEQVVIQHETVQLHETQSRQDLEFQSHVSTLRLQVERVDSVGPTPVLSWLQVVLAVARPCHSAPF